MLHDRPYARIRMGKDFSIPINAACYYHGKVDWIYSANGYNVTPVMFFNHMFNPISGIAMALSNMFIRKNMK